ncbi:MAG TPA: bifunctional serine/threonine-protein kinase/formylglycine-generating enzyme family protein, partial [Polyangiaceae bacterium]
MAAQDPLALVGTTLAEKYQILEVAGTGGYGIVYKATHLIWNRPVAIKVFKALAGFGQEEHQRLLDGFIKEGALLADLSEKTAAICQARDVGVLTTNRGQNVPYMVLEWLEGETLESTLEREKKENLVPRSIEETVELLQPAGEALAIAHRLKVAHRDIKPGNIFLIGDPRGQCTVKLLDFGIAKVVSDAQKEGGGFAETTGQVTSFTPAYGAPEQFTRTHGATGPWTDVFAFALVMVETLCGKEALSGETFMQIAYAAADVQRRPSPRTLGANVSDATEAVFLRALAVNPQERWQSAGDFWNALRESLGMDPMRSMQSTGMTNPIPSRLSGVGFQPSAMPTPQRPLGTGTPPSITSVDPPREPPKSTGLAIGLGVLGAVVVVGLGVAVVVGTGAKKKDTLATTSAVPSASEIPPAVASVAKPTCPTGMIEIPGGRFFMGSDDPNDLPFERPAHNVTLQPFCMDELEVSTKKYVAC